ncbi:hypothetical protein [Granulicella aggregans]|uniref:hypothetical protein n=1 Tax=Granulicella aggregans TaxID=474949 RepID=UPI0021DFD96B|nr:hypothetical protein [Granulicella aggregans]
MHKRTRYSLLLIFVLIAALAIALFLKKEAPPEVARLLPESDAIVYVNLKPVRSATHFDREWSKRPVQMSAEYQHFIDATGIVFERDLDAAAFALHRMDDPNGPNGPVAYSEVFEGRFDGTRLAAYLASIAIAKENYAGHDIYTVPVALVEVPSNDGKPAQAVRLLRVTQLGYDTLAASNMPTAEQIHSILDRYRASASPFSGSSLLSARYHDVPLLSTVWAIGHIGLPFSENGKVTAFGMQLPLPEDTTFVASLRFTTALRLRIDELLPTPAEAEQSASALSALLQLFRSIQNVQSQLDPGQQQSSPENAAVKQFLESVKIVSQKDRATLTATVPIDILKQLTAATADATPDSH